MSKIKQNNFNLSSKIDFDYRVYHDVRYRLQEAIAELILRIKFLFIICPIPCRIRDASC